MLDKYQQEIVKSNEPRIIVEAGAGAGKALLNGSKVVTPKGYINIENLKIEPKQSMRRTLALNTRTVQTLVF